jgi:hypothetical protein
MRLQSLPPAPRPVAAQSGKRFRSGGAAMVDHQVLRFLRFG